MILKKKFVIFMLIILINGIIYFYITKTDTYIIKTGYKLFGSEYCNIEDGYYSNILTRSFIEDSKHPVTGGCALTDYRCKLCKKKYTSSTTITPEICSACAIITNRCSDCGKLKNKN